MDRQHLVLCPRCGLRTVHLDVISALDGAFIDVLIWCEHCDEEHPFEHAEW